MKEKWEEEERLALILALVLGLTLLASGIFVHRPMPIDKYFVFQQMAEVEIAEARGEKK